MPDAWSRPPARAPAVADGRGRGCPCLLAAILVFCGFGTASTQHEPVRELRGPFEVLEVVDGDTVRIDTALGRRTVRLIGIDAPEVRHPEIGREPFGPEAGDFVRSRIPPGTPVWVELDREREDDYGRLLAYLYVPDEGGAWQDGGTRFRQVNLEIARAGFADVLPIRPNVVYADRFREAVDAAREEGRGMWGDASAPADGRADVAGDAPERPHATGDAGATRPEGPIVIACALYNPEGDDRGSEWVSLEVREPVDTRGMVLFDEGSGSTFPLPAGTREPGELRVENPGQGVWNNDGDVVHLLRGDEVVDAWDYGGYDEAQGEVVCRP